MSYHFLPELVGEFSGQDSSDGKLSAPSKSSRIVEKCFFAGKETACYPCSLYGTTLKPSPDTAGMATWMWFVQGSHASHFQPQDSEKANSMSEIYGQKPSESLMKWNRESASWKTSQLSLLTGTLDEYSGIFPRAGIIVDGIAYLQAPSAPLIGGTAYGLWPTPHGFSKDGKSNGPSGNELGRAVNKEKFPTPKARDWKAQGGKFRHSPDLPTHVGGSLNPTWVEWLMGWPLGWTDLKPLEMDKFQQWLEAHGGV